MESLKTSNSQSSIEKEKQIGGITIADFKLQYRAIIIQTVWYWHKNRYIEQWNKTENPEMDPQLYGQLIFEKAGKNIQWKKAVSSINGVRKIGQPHTGPFSYTMHKDKLKIDEKRKCEIGIHQDPRGEHRQQRL